jgi:NitT/TauT family transport system substrate-binding protein
LSEQAVELVSIGYTQVAALTEGQVDAAICYAMNEPVQLEVSGEAVNVIYVADYINLVSNGLITNDRTAAETARARRGHGAGRPARPGLYPGESGRGL